MNVCEMCAATYTLGKGGWTKTPPGRPHTFPHQPQGQQVENERKSQSPGKVSTSNLKSNGSAAEQRQHDQAEAMALAKAAIQRGATVYYVDHNETLKASVAPRVIKERRNQVVVHSWGVPPWGAGLATRTPAADPPRTEADLPDLEP